MFGRTYIVIQPSSTSYVYKKRRRYSFWKFLFDILMIGLTHGWWILWIVIREIFFR